MNTDASIPLHARRGGLRECEMLRDPSSRTRQPDASRLPREVCERFVGSLLRQGYGRAQSAKLVTKQSEQMPYLPRPCSRFVQEHLATNRSPLWGRCVVSFLVTALLL